MISFVFLLRGLKNKDINIGVKIAKTLKILLTLLTFTFTCYSIDSPDNIDFDQGSSAMLAMFCKKKSDYLEVDFALGILSISPPLLGPEANTLIGPNVYRLEGKHYVKWIMT